MKKIIPFEKVIEFNTKISEIVSMSLEEKIDISLPSSVEGELFLEGTYKINPASQIEEDFKYKIPVNVEISDIYDISNVVAKIDNFYYELFENKGIKIFVDLLLDGLEEKVVVLESDNEVINEEVEDEKFEETLNDDTRDNSDTLESDDINDDTRDISDTLETDDIIKGDNEENNINNELKVVHDKLNEMIEKYENNKTDEEIIRDYLESENNKIEKIDVEVKKEEQKTSGVNIMNLFSSSNDSKTETYSAYSVYFVKEDDTLDRIVEKYKTSKAVLEEYNTPLEIKAGMKIIIPSNNE